MRKVIDITPPTQEEIMWAAFADAMKREENSKSLYIANKKRYAEMEKAYKILQELVIENDPDAEFVCKLRDGFKNIGEIECCASDITVQTYEMDRFKEAINLADNFEVHPLTTGKICITMSFVGVMEKKT